jgi:hypothetical protein
MNETDLDTAQIIAILRDTARRQHRDDPQSIMHLAADCILQLKTERLFENEIVVKAAIAAMAAMVAHPNANQWTAKEIAHDAVVQADALLEALQKKGGAE